MSRKPVNQKTQEELLQLLEQQEHHDDETSMTPDDPRLQYIHDYLQMAIKIKLDKWKKLLSQDDSKIMIQHFFERHEDRLLVFACPSGANLQVADTFKAATKHKVVYFVKNNEGQITSSNIRSSVTTGEINPTTFEQLSHFVQEIATSLLGNEKNHSAWPQVVAEDVIKHVRTLNTNVQVWGGHTRGQTVLPLPEGGEKIDDERSESRASSSSSSRSSMSSEDFNRASKFNDVHRALVHAIESTVIEWAHQVQSVLEHDSSQALLSGANPWPSYEIKFWKTKATNLQYIYDQLQDSKVQKMAVLLQKSGSSYWPTFKEMYDKVVSALAEASDISLHLQPLKNCVESMEQGDFSDLSRQLPVFMRLIELLWEHSEHYRSAPRIIVFLQEVNNMIVDQARTYLAPDEIFKTEIEEMQERLQVAVDIFKMFRELFVKTRRNIRGDNSGISRTTTPAIGTRASTPASRMATPNGTKLIWDFPSSMVFAKADRFAARLKKVKSLFDTAIEVMKLEKIEFGGSRGHGLSQQLSVLQLEFEDYWKVFKDATYDSLDPTNEIFEQDYNNFHLRIVELDHRLATIINSAFLDCSGMEAMFKLLTILSPVLQRPVIQQETAHVYKMLLSTFDHELDKCKVVYDQRIRNEEGNLSKNMPPTSGAIQRAKQLKRRIMGPKEQFKFVHHSSLSSDEAQKVFGKYDEMISLLDKFETNRYDSWQDGVEDACKMNLDQPLISREGRNVSVNFSDELSSLLREVKYLTYLGADEVPQSAVELYGQNDTLWKYHAGLEITAAMYNEIQDNLLDVERPLVAGQLSEIDRQLEQAESGKLTWNGTGTWEYIQETRALVQDLEERVHKANDNVKQIEKIMEKWVETPLFVRRDDRRDILLQLDDREERLGKRYFDLMEDAKTIQKLVKENATHFKSDTDSEDWKNYLNYLDASILEGILSAIKFSLKYLVQNTDQKINPPPLFEVKLILSIPDVMFEPSLEFETKTGFYELIDNIINDIFRVSSLISRVAPHYGVEDYFNDMGQAVELLNLRTEIIDRVQVVIETSNEYRNNLEKYAYLWVDDRQEFMRQFLLYNHVLTAEEIEQHADTGVPESPPTLEQFKQQIDSYEQLHEEVTRMPDHKIFSSWFRVDVRPFKQSLLNIIKRWSLMLKEYLISHVVDSLQDLEDFVHRADAGLRENIEEGDYDALVRVMGNLLAVKERQASTDNMFEPLKETVELLSSYEVEIPENAHHQIEQLPEQWESTKKRAVGVRHDVSPLQTAEVAEIRKRCTKFDISQHEFREMFRKTAPFWYNSELPYKKIDIVERLTTEKEKEMAALLESAGLFEVNVPDFKQLKACRKELKILKHLWDMIYLVKSSIDAWTLTSWREIVVEEIDFQLRRFLKDVRLIDKECRSWDAFTGLDSMVKNMLTSLRAIVELRNPAIRDRHWQQLMTTTGVRFNMDDNTTLADLLALQLHKVEDEVKNIVDKAVKEMGIEKVLDEMQQTWGGVQVKFETHHTGTPLLATDEELIETLEDNQVQLQNVLISKFVEYFRDEVSAWQHKLSVTDTVIQVWLEVQRTWVHLETIFIGAEDIRSQLPEDSERFVEIDRDLKELLVESEKIPNIIESAMREGLQAKLEDLLKRLSVCEKSLAEYLERKRLLFPRFYFMSAADLLDILSKGAQPPEVTHHLRKLFDNINGLKFEVSSDGVESANVAVGMYSKEGEYAEFAKSSKLLGQVETWLNTLLKTMQSTVRKTLQEAVVSYEEKPRDQWLFDFPAQIALTGSQIWWTTEVGIAFEKLEEGFENAMKDYNKKQVTQLNALINHLLGQLSPLDRQKIMTMCTIDVHNRDVVSRLITEKVSSSEAFTWLSQLRHRWDDSDDHCYANICNAQFQYQYEYLGNTPRLVITPLTDRCYITLTQSLHLTMSGAPAGPAGTGKTETTKDLGRALGVQVYVFNCSEQMDYRSIGNIYKGLSQTGSWGCFDEFNRIAIEVLSVVAVQVKMIQDSLKAKKTHFLFLGDEIKLCPSVGIFITMNPGYAGRTELPENLKALFRPCAMVVPDIAQICEINLVAEGFTEAKILARKFITLYDLCKELCSKQNHYDWGLRAVKSVLVVAGSLRRADKQRPEDQVLMRALRDFNLPKIVTEDVPIFMGLIGDLFPSLDVPRKRDHGFEKKIRKSILSLKLQPEESFVLKVVQLEELLQVRHSVFVIGGAGSGKSSVLKTLHATHKVLSSNPVWHDLNPKALTTNELFGFIHPSTREWKDGLFSSIMRDQSNLTNDSPKWIVLDGDIDPMWIESLNTVMDDNKVLTLASNERIPLTDSMRLLFEIYHLRSATPATVSRAGILYVNPQDLGWNPPVLSWIDTRKIQSERANLTILFDKYVPTCLDAIRTTFKTVTPIPDNTMVQTLCYLLECLVTPETVPPDSHRDLYELYFVFAAVWAFGGALLHDQLIDHRLEFSRWWVKEFKQIKFPASGTVFDFCIDPKTRKFVQWKDRVPVFEMTPDLPLQSVLVPTAETTRIRSLVDLLLAHERPVMLVGPAGTGKSLLATGAIKGLENECNVSSVPFNYYTTAAMLQGMLEKPLEKKAGHNFGPVGSKRLVYFLDDLNMPKVDEYGTVGPHTLVRQHLDYGHWYDRSKLSLKKIHNTQYIACMNPTAGSFTVNPRLQRHFCVFAVNFPGTESLERIYSAIMKWHITGSGHSFSPGVVRGCNDVIAAAIQLHHRVSSAFLPTAIKFHYIFNLRDLSNIFQGLLFSSPDCIKSQFDFQRLWLHESSRVYRDKMVEERDSINFDKILGEISKKNFEASEEYQDRLHSQPNIFCHFAEGTQEPKYMPVKKFENLQHTLAESLESHNDVLPAMPLVLFNDAINHVCRINRILESPRGNALLVGVGGSGKQSLSRLAAYISGLEVFQLTLKKGYDMQDLKADLANLYMRAGAKGIGTMFLMTDAHVADERFLVLINDHLATGEISDLFTEEEMNEIISGVRTEVRASGEFDSRENCWKFFLHKVRMQLKVVLCFSPVGSTLRVRARKFPALVNCCSIDWFHEWPHEALVSVSHRFVAEIEEIEALEDSEELVKSISQFMAHVHKTVNHASHLYRANERRHNYTTPKSFLEQIALYRHLVKSTDQDLTAKMDRLENGLHKLLNTAEQVDDLKAKLAVQEVELRSRSEETEKLLANVGQQTEHVTAEKEVADEEEKKVAVIAAEVAEKQKSCEEELSKAEPALQAATKALNTLNKTNLSELKSFGQPVQAITNITAAVMCLFAPDGRLPKDRSWKVSKLFMGKVEQFLDQLINYDKENIPEPSLKAVRQYMEDPEFNEDTARTKSVAAAGLCAWVINIVRWYDVYCDVQPKRDALAEANEELAAAQKKLDDIRTKISQLDEDLSRLTAEFENATEEKLKCANEVATTEKTIVLANRLVSGLQSEKGRWSSSVKSFEKKKQTLSGDVLLTAAFVSYHGYFTQSYRTHMLEQEWLPFLKKQKFQIPITENLDPLDLLIDDATIARWNNEKLPADRMSTENAAIVSNCQRWPLLVDPQLQGVKWLKEHLASDLLVVQLGQKGYLDVIEKTLQEGGNILIENIGETIDPVLDSLLGRNTIKKGKYIRIGDKECEFNPKFRLYLHTKLANPHYQPELQAQTTLINFTVTRDGLSDQLLAQVVRAERPDLEALKVELTKQQNDFKITLKQLEDNLLTRLSNAGGNFLGDIELVENLERTKRTSEEIEIKVVEAKQNEGSINGARESYRDVASRAALLYFIMNDLHKINPIYQFSLRAFNNVFHRSIATAEQNEETKERVDNLIDSVTYNTFMYTSRGLFENDKLTFTAQVSFQVLQMRGQLNPSHLDILLKFPPNQPMPSPLDFISNQTWGIIKALALLDEFSGLDRDIEGSPKRWKKLVDSEAPEKEKLPQDWKTQPPVIRMCILRTLRPDRMTYALRDFTEQMLGSKYIENRPIELSKTFEESSRAEPIFFVLSPGVDPLKDVEALGKKLGYHSDHGNFHNISLGQGQEVVAEQALEVAAEKGHWVVLQNVHLVAKWLPRLEDIVEQNATNAHKDYRLFISAEPPASADVHVIPQGILENSVKVTNEPPTGMHANLHAALDNFNQDTLEMCARESEFKSILFSLCYFHAAVAERRKFGPQGWNRRYPFNTGDLTISVNVLYNYLEANVKVPWTDLRYLFGEIMYGGHITDDWDRRLCRTYLEVYMEPKQLDGELMYAPGFFSPPNLDYKGYHAYIDELLPPESPTLYGLHPNAEVGILTVTSDELFRTVLEMQPREGSGGSEGITSIDENVKTTLDEILERLPDLFPMAEIMAKTTERSPYIVVCLQECERMNILLSEIRRSLKELDLGLKGELTFSSGMEAVQDALYYDALPQSWTKVSYPSTYSLSQWFADLLLRCRELETWTQDLTLPATVWLGGLFNPQSFLTAIMQSMARKNEWPLDKMAISVDVTKKQKEDFGHPPREGAYLHGLFLEGARWDMQSGMLVDAKLKELTPTVPVVFAKAIPLDRQDTRHSYECPVYRTRERGPTFVWTFNLKTKEPASKWILAGVALLLNV
ncbi:dynein beta chain, ciliary-like isoform X2 [Styela clava]